MTVLRYINKAPRRKQRGINCGFSTRWLSASLRPEGRGIEPAEIKGRTCHAIRRLMSEIDTLAWQHCEA